MTGTAVRAGTQRWPRTGAGFPGAGQPASSWGFGAWGRMEAVGLWPTGAQTFVCSSGFLDDPPDPSWSSPGDKPCSPRYSLTKGASPVSHSPQGPPSLPPGRAQAPGHAITPSRLSLGGRT